MFTIVLISGLDNAPPRHCQNAALFAGGLTSTLQTIRSPVIVAAGCGSITPLQELAHLLLVHGEEAFVQAYYVHN